MKTWNVYKTSFGATQIVKDGWSWPAFVTQTFGFGWVWAFAKGIWGTAILLMILNLMSTTSLLAMADGTSSSAMFFLFMIVLQFIVWIGVGAIGNKTVASKLVKKGYNMVGSVAAPSKEAALAYHHESQK